jgi:AhpD family alkylhydroperoxidase
VIETSAKSLVEVYDPPMCCTSGVCGPEPDPQLARFSADLAWLRRKGIEVRRHSLTQEPLDFAKNADVKRLMTENNGDGLPVVLVGGKVMQHGTYPSRSELASWLGLPEDEPAKEEPAGPSAGLVTPAVAELIAIGASIASNCEPCFVHHHDQALRFGASNEDMITAVNIGLQVKDAPAQAMVRLARRHLVPNANPSGSGCGEDCSC